MARIELICSAFMLHFILTSFLGPYSVQSIDICLQPDTPCYNGTQKVNSSSLRNCSTLDMALRSIQSNTTLTLSSGNYTMRTNYTVMDKSDVTIMGVPEDPESVVIKCDDSFGLVFLNIQRLYINGLTVQHCGFKGEDQVHDIFTYLNDSILLTFTPLADFSTAVFIANCQDLTIENSIIKGNEGFGLVGVNIIGESRFSHVSLTSNYPTWCITSLEDSPQPGGSGGGMFLLYQDFRNNFTNNFSNSSTFLFEYGHIEDNYNCRFDLFAVQYNNLSRSLEPALSQNNSIIGAGGVTITLSQSSYSVNATFTDCNFTNNSGLYHSAGMEVTQFELTSDTHVLIRNTHFYRNGGLFSNNTDFDKYPLDPSGAFVAVFYSPMLSDELRSNLLSVSNQSSVKLQSCTFRENIAQSGSGVSVVSFGAIIGFIQDIIIIEGCTFQENQGNYGSAMFITEISYGAFEPGLIVIIDSITVVNNQRLIESPSSVRADGTSVIDINYVNVRFRGSNLFESNQDTALAAYNGIVTFSGLANFTNNTGAAGGALHLDAESYLVLVEEANITFRENRGIVYGGAIFVNFDTLRSNTYDCFLFIDRVDIFCDIFSRCPLPNNSFIISFIDNSAPFGNAIFGSSFSSCPWNRKGTGLQFISIDDTINGTWNSSQLPILFVPPFNDSNHSINTFARVVRANNSTEENSSLCDGIRCEATPGQRFRASLGAFDQLNQPFPLTISSQLGNVNISEEYSQIGESNRFLLSGGEQEFSVVPIHVFGKEDVTYTVTITSDDSLLSLNIEVYLKNCSDGFIFNDETWTCDCEITSFLDDVNCTPNGEIMFSENRWIGRDENGNYTQGECILDYCRMNITQINLSEPDTQCRNNRSGILCGECAEGYSRKIGTTSCACCEDSLGWLLIILFAALGILLFVILALFNITITDGYINGFIFYANIIGVFTSTFLPVPDADQGHLSIILISFLNLNFGFEICFYDGATELELVGLQLLFPVYLMLILLIVTLCGKYIPYRRLAFWLQKINVTHIFATLILYSYTSVTQTCIALLSSVQTNGSTPNSVRWRRDPNVFYDSSLHIFLAVLAVLFLIILIPLPIVLLIPEISFRVPYVKKLKPLIDAFIAPFATGKTFWISLRLLFRLVIFSIAARGVSTVQVLFMACLIIILTIVQGYIKPFKTAGRNLIDMLLMINLTLFSVIAIHLHPNILNNEHAYVVNVIFLTFTYIFSAMLLMLFIYYLLVRFSCTRVPCEKAIALIKQKLYLLKDTILQQSEKKMKRQLSQNKDLNPTLTHTSVSVSPRASRFEGTDFIPLREALLEDPLTRDKRTTRTGV